MGRVVVGMRAWRAAVVVLGLAALSSCGSGEQVEPFNPTRILAFGDEQSMLVEPDGDPRNGDKFSVNFFNTATGKRECSGFPIWTQIVAASFNLTFRECNPNNVANPQGQVLATENATVADFAQQIDLFLQTGSFGPQDLVTVYVGLHDILAVYEDGLANPGLGRDALRALVSARGTMLAQQINRIADADGRVLYTTIQDLGVAPLGRANNARDAALLTDLTNAFNLGVKITVKNDGRLIGLVTGDEISKIVGANAAVNGFNNVDTGVCNTGVALLDCTNQTLVTNGDANTFYWADDTRLSPGGHNRLGNAAVARARGNPF
jgi:outer membrane lipase/esterase